MPTLPKLLEVNGSACILHSAIPRPSRRKVVLRISPLTCPNLDKFSTGLPRNSGSEEKSSSFQIWPRSNGCPILHQVTVVKIGTFQKFHAIKTVANQSQGSKSRQWHGSKSSQTATWSLKIPLHPLHLKIAMFSCPMNFCQERWRAITGT